jgi:hypothetical protein
MSSSGTRLESPAPYSRLSLLLAGILDSFSFGLFHLSFSSLAHVAARFLVLSRNVRLISYPKGEETDASSGEPF